jgi:hypothetical protein
VGAREPAFHRLRAAIGTADILFPEADVGTDQLLELLIT